MSFGSFLKAHAGILHSIGDALKILQSATPLIGADGAKVSSIIQDVHDAAHEVGEVAATADQGVAVDPNALHNAIQDVLPGLISEGITLALEKLMPQHVANVVAEATPTVIAAAAAAPKQGE